MLSQKKKINLRLGVFRSILEGLRRCPEFTPSRVAMAFVACAALAACSTTNSVKMDGADTSAHAALLPAGTLTGAQIMQAVSERSFNFFQDGIKGSVTFHGDGTLSYRAPVAGEGTGVWQASDGGLCQALNPTHFLPKGTRNLCHAFISTGQEYQWGRARYTLVPERRTLF